MRSVNKNQKLWTSSKKDKLNALKNQLNAGGICCLKAAGCCVQICAN